MDGTLKGRGAGRNVSEVTIGGLGVTRVGSRGSGRSVSAPVQPFRAAAYGPRSLAPGGMLRL